MTEVRIAVPGNHLMVGLLGQRDELLRLVEDAFPDAAVVVRGNEINVTGEGARAAARTARSASSDPASATVRYTSPFAGLTVSNVRPSAAATRSPSMTRYSTALTAATS